MNQNSHCPWELPKKPWVLAQTWEKSLFCHWPTSVNHIRSLVPSIIEIDTFDKEAWISVVPFQMSDIRLRLFPIIPLVNKFPELNVRTYVIHQGKPGIFLFSCDAANHLVVSFARTVSHLPYFHAQMELSQKGEEIEFISKRTHHNTPGAKFHSLYYPISDAFHARKDSLDYWLMERYCLYTIHQRKLYRTDIHHSPWPLQHAEAELIHNNAVKSCNITIKEDQKPLLHFAKKLRVKVWSHFIVND